MLFRLFGKNKKPAKLRFSTRVEYEQEPSGFTAAEIKAIDARARTASRSLLRRPVEGIIDHQGRVGAVLGVGQSFMIGGVNSSRLNLTPDRIDIHHRAMMLGDADRCQRNGSVYDQFGPLAFRPLLETLVRGDRIYSEAERRSGAPPANARGATPIVGACILFDRLLLIHQKLSRKIDPGFDVAVNVAVSQRNLADISSYPAIDRAFDAFEKVKTVANRDFPEIGSYHAATLERHGQADEARAVPTAQYTERHRDFRAKINARSAHLFGNELPAPWIGTQVSGAYGTPQRRVAMAQLTMALKDTDYILACPDYPFAHFGKAPPHHPRAGDRHPTANATLLPSIYMAWARFKTQVLRKNWFPTYMADTLFRGRTIIVAFRAMKPPLVVSEVCVGTTMSMIHALGFDVDDDFGKVRIAGVDQVGSLTFRIECARPLTSPFVGLAKGSYGTADIGAEGTGATNIKDSQTLSSLFWGTFEEGYTNMLPGGEDRDCLEEMDAMLGKQVLGNWAVAQRRRCTPA